MNILDYLDWRGDLTFDERELNEVDNVIFSVLAYVEMDGLLGADDSEFLTIAQLCRAYEESGRQSTLMLINPVPLLEKAAEAPRFKDVRVAYYVSETDQENHSQFAAVTFLYKKDEAYIAFRGTDSTIVGWREDFNLSFMDETPGQHSAVHYLDRVAGLIDCRLTIGGHSKGGNFAVFAASCCDERLRGERIMKIYNNDGPGFKENIIKREGYQVVKDKIVKLIPGSSAVGILLEDIADRRFIKSTAKGPLQHDPLSWCVFGTRLEDADERSPFSYFVDNTLSKWLSGMEQEQRKTLVDTFFDVLMIDGARTLADLGENKLATYRAMAKALSGIESGRKSEILASLQKLAASGFDTVKSNFLRQKEAPAPEDESEDGNEE